MYFLQNLKISQKWQVNNSARVYFLNKLADLSSAKETLAKVFSCAFWEIFKNNFFSMALKYLSFSEKISKKAFVSPW